MIKLLIDDETEDPAVIRISGCHDCIFAERNTKYWGEEYWVCDHPDGGLGERAMDEARAAKTAPSGCPLKDRPVLLVFDW